mmetsp:Transcript_3749/g.5863  ORF Transcript_3749/g.5863 Transcript_3749/m.5863 type:complete len:248 (-) Transcript_3749:1678-2421(-)
MRYCTSGGRDCSTDICFAVAASTGMLLINVSPLIKSSSTTTAAAGPKLFLVLLLGEVVFVEASPTDVMLPPNRLPVLEDRVRRSAEAAVAATDPPTGGRPPPVPSCCCGFSWSLLPPPPSLELLPVLLPASFPAIPIVVFDRGTPLPPLLVPPPGRPLGRLCEYFLEASGVFRVTRPGLRPRRRSLSSEIADATESELELPAPAFLNRSRRRLGLPQRISPKSTRGGVTKCFAESTTDFAVFWMSGL